VCTKKHSAPCRRAQRRDRLRADGWNVSIELTRRLSRQQRVSEQEVNERDEDRSGCTRIGLKEEDDRWDRSNEANVGSF